MVVIYFKTGIYTQAHISTLGKWMPAKSGAGTYGALVTKGLRAKSWRTVEIKSQEIWLSELIYWFQHKWHYFYPHKTSNIWLPNIYVQNNKSDKFSCPIWKREYKLLKRKEQNDISKFQLITHVCTYMTLMLQIKRKKLYLPLCKLIFY